MWLWLREGREMWSMTRLLRMRMSLGDNFFVFAAAAVAVGWGKSNYFVIKQDSPLQLNSPFILGDVSKCLRSSSESLWAPELGCRDDEFIRISIHAIMARMMNRISFHFDLIRSAKMRKINFTTLNSFTFHSDESVCNGDKSMLNVVKMLLTLNISHNRASHSNSTARALHSAKKNESRTQ